MSLVYKKMDLFDAPKGSVLVHAGNAQGVWGSGIAAEFHKRFPKAFESYNNECFKNSMIGDYDCTEENDYIVATIITSENYGGKVDNPEEILVNTTLALDSLCRILNVDDLNGRIYSNKFNSGLFNVPWEKTEAILKVFVKRYDLNWTVCEK
jgi:ADP-ribose 1''-phosphate phosphatase